MGREFAINGIISEGLKEKMAAPVRLKKSHNVIIKALTFLGIFNLNWNMQLKKNGALENCSSKPYA